MLVALNAIDLFVSRSGLLLGAVEKKTDLVHKQHIIIPEPHAATPNTENGRIHGKQANRTIVAKNKMGTQTNMTIHGNKLNTITPKQRKKVHYNIRHPPPQKKKEQKKTTKSKHEHR